MNRFHLNTLLFSSVIFTSCLGSPLQADPIDLSKFSRPVRVACVGDSITDGFGVGRDWAYPGQLGRMLGPKWWVLNYGATGTTVLKDGNDPYWAHGQIKKAYEFNPDVVVIELTTNDTKAVNWVHKDEIPTDYRALIDSFRALPSKPEIYLCLPAPVTPPGNMGIPQDGPSQTDPMVAQIAKDAGCSTIDFFAALTGHPDWQPDHIHPDPDGDYALAKAVYAALIGAPYAGNVVLMSQAPKPIPQPPAGQ